MVINELKVLLEGFVERIQTELDNIELTQNTFAKYAIKSYSPLWIAYYTGILRQIKSGDSINRPILGLNSESYFYNLDNSYVKSLPRMRWIFNSYINDLGYDGIIASEKPDWNSNLDSNENIYIIFDDGEGVSAKKID